MKQHSNLRRGIKATVKFIAGVGAATITTQIIKNNTDPNNVIQKVTITIGAFALGSMLADAAMTQAGKDFDEAAEFADGVRYTVQEKLNENKK